MINTLKIYFIFEKIGQNLKQIIFFFLFFFFIRDRPLLSPGGTAALRLIVHPNSMSAQI
jgi:hypothetical protein